MSIIRTMSNQRGFTHLVLLLVVIVACTAYLCSRLPISRTYFNGSSNVNGVALAQAATPLAGKDMVKVVSDSGKVALVKGNAGAVSNFPLTVDPRTNSLTVTTPSGTKTVAILPDAAIRNLVEGKVLDDVTSVAKTGTMASINQLITLEERANVLGYFIEGQKKHLLLGFISIKTDVSAFVSAENGQVVSSSTSLLGRILNKIAP